jgi:hypothetical protein
MRRELLSNGFGGAALCAVLVLATTFPAQAGQISKFGYSPPGTGSTPLSIPASGVFATTNPIPVFFNFSYSLPGFDLSPTPMPVSASGTLTAFQIAADTYLASAISGRWNGVSILSLLSPGTFGGNDNLLFTTGDHLSTNGLSYTVNGAGDDGTGNVNVFSVGGGLYTENSPDVGFGPDFNLSIQVPEPASAALLCTAIPVALFVLRRRSMAKKRASSALC